MRPLRYSINITLDGCCDHTVGQVDAELHAYSTDMVARSGGMILGRKTYELMEAWRPVEARGPRPDWVEDWMVPFADAIGAIRKYVVSDTLSELDWNSEVVRGDRLEQTVRALKAEPGRPLACGGVQVPLALARLGLIDEYEFLVHPVIAGRGPTLLAGLAEPLTLKLVDRHEFTGGAVALLYTPR